MEDFSDVYIPPLKYFPFSIISVPSLDLLMKMSLVSASSLILLCISALSVVHVLSISARFLLRHSFYACLHLFLLPLKCPIFCAIPCQPFFFPHPVLFWIISFAIQRWLFLFLVVGKNYCTFLSVHHRNPLLHYPECLDEQTTDSIGSKLSSGYHQYLKKKQKHNMYGMKLMGYMVFVTYE